MAKTKYMTTTAMNFGWSTFFLIFVALTCIAAEEDLFLLPPTNNTVVVGSPAIMKCKFRTSIHTCRWFHLDIGLPFNDESNPSLVKEFTPAKKTDCSIRFKHVKKIQEGQWVCKGLKIHTRTYITSKPAVLRVWTPRNATNETTDGTQSQNQSTVHFARTTDDHIVNVHLGSPAALSCKINSSITKCFWLTPVGKIIPHDGTGSDNVTVIKSNMTEGSCPLQISMASSKDEGNWRCGVTVSGEAGDRLGPLIHLHIFEYGDHEGTSQEKQSKSSNTHLIVILTSSFAGLIVIILVLVFCMYKKVWSHSAQQKAFRSFVDSNSEYSTAPTRNWLSNMQATDQNLLDEDAKSTAPPGAAQCYVDMSGNSAARDSYVLFPSSNKSSMTNIPVRIVMVNNDNKTGRSGSNASVSTFENTSSFGFDPSGRPYSGSSSDHLYEEIKELKVPKEHPTYANAEDSEGYLLPKHSPKIDNRDVSFTADDDSSTTIPDIVVSSNCNNSKLCKTPPKTTDKHISTLANSATNSAKNSTTSLNDLTTDSDINYDTPPQGPPVPISTPRDSPIPPSSSPEPPERFDSCDNPLANYDVPSSSKSVSSLS